MIFKVFGFLYSIRGGSTIASYNIIQYTAQYVIVQGASAVVCVGVWPVLPGFDVVEFTSFT